MKTLIIALAICGSVAQAAPTLDSKPFNSTVYPVRSPNMLSGEYATDFAWSPDGKTLATGDQNAALHFWDARTGERKAGLAREFESTYKIAYSPDGKLFAIGTSQLVGVSLWDTRTGQLVRTLKEPYPLSRGAHIFSFFWSPDGQTLVVSHLKDLQFWDVASGKLLKKMAKPGGGYGGPLLLSHDGKKLATSRTIERNEKNEAVKVEAIVTDWRKGKILSRNADAGFPLAWSPDDSRLFTRMTDARNDNRVGQWFLDKNVFRPTSTDELTASGSAQPFALAPDGVTFALGRKDGTIRLRQARHGELLQTLNASDNLITGAAFSPDGKTLVSSGYDGKLNFWRVQNSSED